MKKHGHRRFPNTRSGVVLARELALSLASNRRRVWAGWLSNGSHHAYDATLYVAWGRDVDLADPRYPTERGGKPLGAMSIAEIRAEMVLARLDEIEQYACQMWAYTGGR